MLSSSRCKYLGSPHRLQFPRRPQRRRSCPVTPLINPGRPEHMWWSLPPCYWLVKKCAWQIAFSKNRLCQYMSPSLWPSDPMALTCLPWTAGSLGSLPLNLGGFLSMVQGCYGTSGAGSCKVRQFPLSSLRVLVLGARWPHHQAAQAARGEGPMRGARLSPQLRASTDH